LHLGQQIADPAVWAVTYTARMGMAN